MNSVSDITKMCIVELVNTNQVDEGNCRVIESMECLAIVRDRSEEGFLGLDGIMTTISSTISYNTNAISFPRYKLVVVLARQWLKVQDVWHQLVGSVSKCMQGFSNNNITNILESLMVEVCKGRRKGKQDSQFCLVLFLVSLTLLFQKQHSRYMLWIEPPSWIMRLIFIHKSRKLE
jgi:hypothetical protein